MECEPLITAIVEKILRDYTMGKRTMLNHCTFRYLVDYLEFPDIECFEYYPWLAWRFQVALEDFGPKKHQLKLAREMKWSGGKLATHVLQYAKRLPDSDNSDEEE